MTVLMSSACSLVSPPPCAALLRQQVRSSRCPGHGSALRRGWIHPQCLLRSFHPFSSPTSLCRREEKGKSRGSKNASFPQAPLHLGLVYRSSGDPHLEEVGVTDDRYWHG